MKKGISICLGVLIVFAVSTIAYATEISGARWVDTETVNNGGEAATIPVNTDVIYPEGTAGHRSGSKVLGFSVMPKKPTLADFSGLPVNTEAFATLYDTTDVDLDEDTNEIINEIEGPNGAGDDIWFPYPYTVQNQVISRQGAWTEVCIYFVE